MTKTPSAGAVAAEQVPHFDVLIVGAGISGIGAAYHLTHEFPDKSFLVLDTHEDFGGTWWTHQYPGARTDSDMYTFGYRFKPWRKGILADREEIRDYLAEVIAENGLDAHIRYQHRVTAIHWSTPAHRWTVEVTRTDTREPLRLTTDFLWMCQGYYDHDEGHMPQWPGMHRFQGRIVHPQKWPKDLAYEGKRVVVIGSGATAATLVPTLAKTAAHVTMLQRTPTYYVISPPSNPLADRLHELDVPHEWTHEILRRAVIADVAKRDAQIAASPEAFGKVLIDQVRAALPEDFDVEKHFTPPYLPGQQRICRIPEGDLFKAISDGTASVVTDHIETFTESGVRVASGETIEADIVITATGFNLSILGGIAVSLDERQVDLADTVTYRAAMFTGVPNLVHLFGYLRHSWTLRVDLLADFVCRLLHHMEGRGATVVQPVLRAEDANMALRPWTDLNKFNAGYALRTQHVMPKQGDRVPWLGADIGYEEESLTLPFIDLDDGTLAFT